MRDLENTLDKLVQINEKDALEATIQDWAQVLTPKDPNDEALDFQVPDFEDSDFEDQVDEEPFDVTKRDEESKSGLSWSDEAFMEDCCPLCSHVCTEPAVLQCGHSFCNGCVQECEKWKKSFKCSLCNKVNNNPEPPVNVAMMSLSESDRVDPSGGQRNVQPLKLSTPSSPELPLSEDLTEETSVFGKHKENVPRVLIIKCVETLVVTTVVTFGEADED
ncbi:nuclear factor 7, brain-like [Oreochromis niloticus]|uniref:nuclear factor 7, brain-like n=1 Tax=Oreochromis niloticus TaxID=8128 RepID=UPI000904BC04|nr:nuclear factor 7, brain-like [Oreochromis niloticus]